MENVDLSNLTDEEIANAVEEWGNPNCLPDDFVEEYCDEEEKLPIDVESVIDITGCVGDDKYSGLGEYVLDSGVYDVPEELRGYIDTFRLGRDWSHDYLETTNFFYLEA